MRTSLLASIVVLCLAGAAFADSPASIETSSSRITIDPGGRAITALSPRAGERNFIDAAAGSAYSIQFVGDAAPVSARDAAEVRLQAQDRAIILEARHSKPASFTVTCRFEPDGDMILARMAIRSPQEVRIASVVFPTITLKLPLGGTGQDDAILAPYCDGQLMLDPAHNRFDGSINYPGAASMQLLAAFDKTAGVYLAARDSEGCAKSLVVQRRGNAQELSIRHLPPQSPVKEWSLPYAVAITTFDIAPGAVGWEAAADIYRQWALKQPWCAKTVRQRVAADDIASWLVEPSLFYTFSLRGQLQDKSWTNRASLAGEQARRWREALGGPVTFMAMSWEKLDSWATPDYFPPSCGTDAFKSMTRRLHDDGHHSLVFLSGLKWTLQKARPRSDGQPVAVVDQQAEFDRRGKPHAISDDKQQPLIAGKPDQDVGQYAQICPTTPLAAELLLEIVKQCQELGIDCVQADQIVGGGSPPCFHPGHRHPPGGGNWSARALYDLFEKIRKEGRARSRDFAFAIEEPAEFFLPVLDTCHTRDYQQNRWPRSGPARLGVPLFTHVYHEFLHGYGGDSAAVSDKPSDMALYHQGMNLVCGKAAAVSVWTRWFDPSSVDAAQRRMLKSHLDLWRGDGKEFLVYGRRLATPLIDVPTIPITFPDKEPKNRRVMEMPAVLHALWQAADGRKAIVFACIGREKVTFTAMKQSITLEPGEAILKVLP